VVRELLRVQGVLVDGTFNVQTFNVLTMRWEGPLRRPDAVTAVGGGGCQGLILVSGVVDGGSCSVPRDRRGDGDLFAGNRGHGASSDRSPCISLCFHRGYQLHRRTD